MSACSEYLSYFNWTRVKSYSQEDKCFQSHHCQCFMNGKIVCMLLFFISPSLLSLVHTMRIVPVYVLLVELWIFNMTVTCLMGGAIITGQIYLYDNAGWFIWEQHSSHCEQLKMLTGKKKKTLDMEFLKYRDLSSLVITESFMLNMNPFNPCRYIPVIFCWGNLIIVLNGTSTLISPFNLISSML